MSENNELVIHREENFALGRLQPQNVKELLWFAQQVATSGLFPSVTNGQQAFALMSQGVELGLSPLQSLRELNIINGRVDIPASVRAAKIQASPKTEQWELIEMSDDVCTITAKRKDRSNAITVTVKAEDMAQADLNKHKAHLADWLYARAVRRISRTYFADFALGMEEENYSDRPAPDRVISIGAVERTVGADQATEPCSECGSPTRLVPTNNGGVFASCPNGHTQPPPQAVRDAVRGHGDDFATTVVDHLPAPTVDPGEPEGRDATPAEVAELAGTVEAGPALEVGLPTMRDGDSVTVTTTFRKPAEPGAITSIYQEDIIAKVKANMTGMEPSPWDEALLGSYGWDRKQKLRVWLESLDADTLFQVFTDINKPAKAEAPA